MLCLDEARRLSIVAEILIPMRPFNMFCGIKNSNKIRQLSSASEKNATTGLVSLCGGERINKGANQSNYLSNGAIYER